MRPLSREIIGQYNLNINRYQYVRSNYYLDTSKGKYILRKLDIPKEQIIFDYEVDAQIKGYSSEIINHIIPNKNGLPYTQTGEQYYIVQRYNQVDETDFRCYEDLKGIVNVLGEFHKRAKNINSHQKSVDTVRIKNIYEHYNKRKSENSKLKKTISTLKQKSSFEIMFLDKYDVYNELEEMALSSISKEIVDNLIKKVRQEKCIAHKDITYHTIGKDTKNEYIISSIDKCAYDIQVLDLSQILSKIMQKNDWNCSMLYSLVEEYSKIYPLSSEDLKLLKFSIIYPEKFNSICFKYISSKRRWNYSMFEKKWESMLDYQTNQVNVANEIIRW